MSTPVDKVCASADEAVAELQSGSTIMVGGFGDAGVPCAHRRRGPARSQRPLDHFEQLWDGRAGPGRPLQAPDGPSRLRLVPGAGRERSLQ
ncbi:MAG: hypothetical protein EXR61_02790 [Chloroflexi bacterium]|nr:hypothetical protein [Chloroflexota bacterium]